MKRALFVGLVAAGAFGLLGYIVGEAHGYGHRRRTHRGCRRVEAEARQQGRDRDRREILASAAQRVLAVPVEDGMDKTTWLAAKHADAFAVLSDPALAAADGPPEPGIDVGLARAIMLAVGAGSLDDFGISYRDRRGFSPSGLAGAIRARLSAVGDSPGGAE